MLGWLLPLDIVRLLPTKLLVWFMHTCSRQDDDEDDDDEDDDDEDVDEDDLRAVERMSRLCRLHPNHKTN